MELPVKSFQEELAEDLERRNALSEELSQLFTAANEEFVEVEDHHMDKVAELSLRINQMDQGIIRSLLDELHSEREKPTPQAHLDETLLDQIRHWREVAATLEMRLNQFARTHF